MYLKGAEVEPEWILNPEFRLGFCIGSQLSIACTFMGSSCLRLGNISLVDEPWSN
jgi:hypothetical protein